MHAGRTEHHAIFTLILHRRPLTQRPLGLTVRPTSTKPSRMSFFEDIKKPINLLSIILAVLSLILSVYFYLASVQRREPYYLAHATSHIVSKTVVSPNFTVVDATGEKIAGDIHVLEVSFWNGGRLGIEPQDVRTPVFVEFPPGTRLLDAKVSKENKPAISQVRIIEMPSKPGSAPRVALNWFHLDPGLGARLQFIYVGEPNAPAAIRGDILDADIEDASGRLNRVASGWVRTATLLALAVASQILPDLVKIQLRSTASLWLWLSVACGKRIVIWVPLAAVGWFLFASKSPPV
jgi:hypothetical protein